MISWFNGIVPWEFVLTIDRLHKSLIEKTPRIHSWEQSVHFLNKKEKIRSLKRKIPLSLSFFLSFHFEKKGKKKIKRKFLFSFLFPLSSIPKRKIKRKKRENLFLISSLSFRFKKKGNEREKRKTVFFFFYLHSILPLKRKWKKKRNKKSSFSLLPLFLLFRKRK